MSEAASVTAAFSAEAQARIAAELDAARAVAAATAVQAKTDAETSLAAVQEENTRLKAALETAETTIAQMIKADAEKKAAAETAAAAAPEAIAAAAIGQKVKVHYSTEDSGKGDGSRIEMFIAGTVVEVQDGGAIVARINHPGNAADGQAVRVAFGNWKAAD